MKKLFAALIAICIVAGLSFPVGAIELINEGYDEIIVAENFESGKIETAQLLEVKSGTTAYNFGGEHGFVAKIDASGSGDNFVRIRNKQIDRDYVSGQLPSVETATRLAMSKLEIDVYFVDDIKNTLQIYGYNSSQCSLIDFNSGVMTFLGTDETENYSTGEWYKICAYLDFTDNTYTVDINGNTVCKNGVIPDNIIAVSSYGIYIKSASAAGSMYVDNIKYSVPRLYENEKERSVLFDDYENTSRPFRYDNKGNISYGVAPSEGSESHGKVTVITNETSASDSTLTDSFIRPHHTVINPAYTTTAFTGDALKEAQHAKVTIDLYFRDLSNSSITFRTQTGINARTGFAAINFTSDGNMVLANGRKFSYEANKWYSFDFNVNFVTNNYDVYVNDELLCEAVYMPNGDANGKYLLAVEFGFSGARYNPAVVATEVDNYSISFVKTSYRPKFFETRQGSSLSKINYLSALAESTIIDSQIGEIIYEDRFEADSLGNYDGKGDKENNYASYEPDADHDKVLRFFNTEEDGNKYSDSFYRLRDRIIHPEYSSEMLTDEELEKMQKITVEFDLYFSDLVNANFITKAYYEENETIKSTTQIPLRFDASGNVSIATSIGAIESIATYEKEEWYSYKLYLDYVTDTYAIWRDDVLLKKDVPLGSDCAYSLSFGVQFNGKDHPRRQFVELDNFSVKHADISITTNEAPLYSGMKLRASLYDSDGEFLRRTEKELTFPENDIALISTSFDTEGTPGVIRKYSVWKETEGGYELVYDGESMD